MLDSIEEADLIVFSMGSLYTSILPNLISDEMVDSIKKSKARILYACNVMTQPGETDNFTVGDHIKVLNSYLKKRKVDIVIMNNGTIDAKLIQKYASLEQKDPVKIDPSELKKLGVQVIEDDLVSVETGTIRHNTMKLAFHIFSSIV